MVGSGDWRLTIPLDCITDEIDREQVFWTRWKTMRGFDTVVKEKPIFREIRKW